MIPRIKTFYLRSSASSADKSLLTYHALIVSVLGLGLLPLVWLYLPLLFRPGELFGQLSILSHPRQAVLLQNSLAVSGLAALVSAITGVAVALAITSTCGMIRTVIIAASLVPFVIPPFVQAVSWIELLNAGGSPPFTAHGMIAWFGFSESVAAILESSWVLALAFYPCVTWVTLAALAFRARDLEDDLRVQGGGMAAGRHLFLPLLMPSTIAGMMLVFFWPLQSLG